MAAECGHRAHDRTEIPGVGDVVERHQQRRHRVGLRRGQQIVGVGVVVGRDLQRDALMHAVGGDAVQVVARHLEDRDARVGGGLHGLGQTFIRIRAQRHVQRRGRHPGAQAFDHGVAPEHDLHTRVFRSVPGPALLLAGGLGGTFGCGMIGPLVGGRGGTLTFQPTPPDPAGADRRPLLGAGLAYRAPPLRVAGHYLSVPSMSDH